MNAPATEQLGDGRLRGWVELVLWLAVAVTVVAVVIWQGNDIAGWVLVVVILAALSPYVVKSLRAIRGNGRLVVDSGRRAFYRGGRLVVRFDDVAALCSHGVNGSCEEFELIAELTDGRRVLIYEGEATNAAFRTLERIALQVGVPFDHSL
jgi:hypothetical protein